MSLKFFCRATQPHKPSHQVGKQTRAVCSAAPDHHDRQAATHHPMHSPGPFRSGSPYFAGKVAVKDNARSTQTRNRLSSATHHTRHGTPGTIHVRRVRFRLIAGYQRQSKTNAKRSQAVRYRDLIPFSFGASYYGGKLVSSFTTPAISSIF